MLELKLRILTLLLTLVYIIKLNDLSTISPRDFLDIHKSADRTNLNEVVFEEYKRTCQNYDILSGQKICRNCTAKLLHQT